MKEYIGVLFMALSLGLSAQHGNEDAEKWMGNRPDGHAPITVMGDHLHHKGGFMISYRYMHMNMEDLLLGGDEVSFQSVLLPNGGSYMVTPTKMPMNMHMIGAMYAPSNRLSLMIMGSIVDMEMDHLTAMGTNFTTESSSFGDTRISGLYKIFNRNAQYLHARLGVSVPTGSIEEMDVTPASSPNEVILPYPMQIGSGTWDFETALTYLWQCGDLSGGNQLNATWRTGTNDNEYRLGNQYSLQNWIAYRVLDWLSFSGRIEGRVVDAINGANPDLNPMMVITADTANSGGRYLNGGLGFNLYVPQGSLKNLRFGFEVSGPFIQNLNGVQLKTKESVTAGVQYGF